MDKESESGRSTQQRMQISAQLACRILRKCVRAPRSIFCEGQVCLTQRSFLTFQKPISIQLSTSTYI